MPYTQPIGPLPANDTSLEAMVESAIWGGQEGVTNATPEEQAQAAADLQATNFVDTGIVPTAPTLSQWLQRNATAVYVGTGVLVLMAMFGGRRR